MEANQIIDLISLASQGFSGQVLLIDPRILLASIILSIALLLVPPRLATALGSFGLALLGILLVIEPNYAVIIFGFGCVLLGLIRLRRKLIAMEQKLGELTRTVEGLEVAENRRFMRELNSPISVSSFAQDGPSIISSEEINLVAENHN
jgi:hypothetical protein